MARRACRLLDRQQSGDTSLWRLRVHQPPPAGRNRNARRILTYWLRNCVPNAATNPTMPTAGSHYAAGQYRPSFAEFDANIQAKTLGQPTH